MSVYILHAYPRWIPCDIGLVQVYVAFEFMFAFYAAGAKTQSNHEEKDKERCANLSNARKFTLGCV